MLGKSDAYPTIAVNDLNVAKQFYGEILGLELESENPGGVMYKSGRTQVFIYPSVTAGTNQATYANWTVEDVTAVIKDLKDKGVTFEQYDNLPGVERDGDLHTMGELQAAWFKDPSGNILSVTNSAG